MLAAETPTIWLGLETAALAGLLASIVGQVLLGDRPWMQVRAFHDARVDEDPGEVSVRSFVQITNVRGRPVLIERVAILRPGDLATPRLWLEALPSTLHEGMVARFAFDRLAFPDGASGPGVDGGGSDAGRW